MYRIPTENLLAQQAEVHKFFTLDPVLSAWLLVPGMILVGAATFYLYRAQRQIASPRLVTVLTAIRLLLIALLLALLLRPLWVWKQTASAPQTVWVLVDQSLSMGQADAQATPLEQLRRAGPLGELPPNVRPSPLERLSAQLSALRGELVNLEQGTAPSTALSGTSAQREAFLADLARWRDKFTTTLESIARAPGIESGDGPAVVRDLQQTFKAVDRGVKDSGARADPTQAANDLPWSRIATTLEASAARLRTIADRVDLEIVKAHAADPALAVALASAAKRTRAELAYATLVASASQDESLLGFLQRQHTCIAAFGSGTTNLAGKGSDLAGTFKAALDPTASATNLGGALQFVDDQIVEGEPASVLVVSDGRSNTGVDPADAARRLAARGVRVFSLAVGSRQPVPDAAVESVDAPDWIYKEDTLRASALVRLDNLTGKSVKVELLRNQTVVSSQSISPATGEVNQSLTFEDRPPEPGVFDYQIRILPVPGETVADNNTQDFRVSVKSEKFQVLIIEDQPRWEYRYLANYLKRDNRVHLQTILLEPARVEKIAPPPPVMASPLNERVEANLLPATREQWSAFDMIVLGDVPPEFLTPDAQESIAKAVRQRGTTLVMIAGPLNFPQRYAASPLADLLPVQLRSNWDTAALTAHLTQGFRPMVAPEGINSVLSQFEMDERTNDQLWAQLPEFYWHSEQTQAKPGASVLWQIPNGQVGAQDTIAAARQRTLLATMPAGMGRVMYVASDSTWRLRQVNGENLHERFWGQVVGWAAGNDMPAGGRFVRFGADKARYAAGEPAHITARLLNRDFTPLTGQKAKAVAQIGTSKVEAELTENPQTPGLYQATLSDLPAGAGEISLAGLNLQSLLDEDPSASQKTFHIEVQSQAAVEHRNVNPDRAALAAVTRNGNGFSLDIEDADVLAHYLPQSSRELTTTRQFGVFADPDALYTRIAHWSFLALFVLLISAEWLLRKAGGLV